MNTASQHPVYDEATPVLIVGGGLVGLSTCLFLAFHGIRSLLVERHASTAIHPRAMGMSPRTMELFRSVGVEEAIRQVEPPPFGGETILAESLVGQLLDVEKTCRVHFTAEVDAPKSAEFFMKPAMKKEQPKQAALLKSMLANRAQNAN